MFRERGEAGWTLIEVLVVLLIVGLLSTIALATFLGARTRAQDRAAQSDLRNAAAAAKTWLAGARTYAGFTPGAAGTARAEMPSLVWAGPGAPGPGQVSIVVADGFSLLLVRRSDSGAYFCLAEQPNAPGYLLGRGGSFDQVDTIPDCGGGW